MLTLEGCRGGPPRVELRPACVLGYRSQAERRSETSRTPVAGVKAVLSPTQKVESPCLQGHEGGIQAHGRGWAPSIWGMSANWLWWALRVRCGCPAGDTCVLTNPR
jgi:hypothetical protein